MEKKLTKDRKDLHNENALSVNTLCKCDTKAEEAQILIIFPATPQPLNMSRELSPISVSCVKNGITSTNCSTLQQAQATEQHQFDLAFMSVKTHQGKLQV